MGTRFTRGPHRVEQIGRRPLMRAVTSTVISKTGERLADFRHTADANLFSAAPDLLEALQEAAEYIGDRSAGSARFWDMYDAAISRATGEG